MHEQPVRPFHDDEILGERVGQHVSVGHNVHDIDAAVLLPQRHVGGADIEEKNVLVLGPVGELEQRVGRGVDDDVMMTGLEEFLQGGDRLLRRGDGADIEAVGVAGEPAAGIVLLDGHLGSGDAGVVGLLVETRGGPWVLAHLADIADGKRGERRRLRQLNHDAAVALWRGPGAVRGRGGSLLSARGERGQHHAGQKRKRSGESKKRCGLPE
jgi:hypothetical protein